MKHLNRYLNKIAQRGNAKLSESIRTTAEEIGELFISKFSFMSHEIGLLFGNVQSGKTGQMFGVLTKAADLGFPVFLILTTDNIVLQQQTLNRVLEDLDDFIVCGENDTGLFIQNQLVKPTIIVIKKNAKMLRLWSNVLLSTGFMKGNPLFIIDDEADSASLNTLVNSNGHSSINKYLSLIRNGSFSSIYLQVTGTPQSIFLQSLTTGWQPYFNYYFNPGDGYLGGDFFFPATGKASCISFLELIENPTRNVVVQHLVTTAQIFASGGIVSNCLIHPSIRQNVHLTFENEIRLQLKWCFEHFADEFLPLALEFYSSIDPRNCPRVTYEEIKVTLEDMFTKGLIKVFVINATTSVSTLDYSEGCNFIVGGNSLGRGVTFPSLQTIYYSRSSKNPLADTMWQHSRMFGYDRDPGLMKVFIDEKLYKLFSDINATNNSLISQVASGLKNIKVFYPPGINPTRRNVLDKKKVRIITGGTNYFPFSLENNTHDEIDLILSTFSEDEPFYQVSMKIVSRILSHISTSPDFKLNAFQSIIEAMISQEPTIQCILIVRRNRDITQGTGALLSPNDWTIGGQHTNKMVLTMYQVTGKKGWGGKPLWVPNIKLPHDIVYYDVT